jgi:SAM-dependent methyltransferase
MILRSLRSLFRPTPLPSRERAPASGKLDLTAAYTRLTDRLKEGRTHSAAMRRAVGGEFESFGVIERELLRFYGLETDAYLIDIGCGSGRLTQALAEDHDGRYLGTDIVPELLQFARENCGRPGWRFELATGPAIPEQNHSADMVCFFSVLTHLLHEQSYLYLEEARRVLKPGGRIVFSFLEYKVAAHWAVFSSTVDDARDRDEHPLNVFMDRDGIRAWAEHLGLQVLDFQDGDKPFVPLPHTVTLDDGVQMAGLGYLGQSICVLGTSIDRGSRSVDAAHHARQQGDTSSSIIPESGWWWNSSESGRGYAIGVSGSRIFMAAHMYRDDGSAVWYVASGTLGAGSFVAEFSEYRGGETLSSTYRPVSLLGPAATAIVTFSSATAGTIIWYGGALGIGTFSTEIARFPVNGSALLAPALAPALETGWYWNADESGAGYFIELQGSTVYMAAYLYESDGSARWYVASGAAAASGDALVLTASLQEYENGQSLRGAYRAPTRRESPGQVTLEFASSTSATLTLPNGRQVALSRFTQF